MNFNKKVYNKLKEVPKGKIITYKLLAEAINSKGYRAVGNALNKNKNSPEIPCHRVINSDGHLGGFSKGIKRKIYLLQREGIKINNGKVVYFNKNLYKLREFSIV